MLVSFTSYTGIASLRSAEKAFHAKDQRRNKLAKVRTQMTLIVMIKIWVKTAKIIIIINHHHHKNQRSFSPLLETFMRPSFALRPLREMRWRPKRAKS